MEIEDLLSNWCGDIVAGTRFEPALVHLFRDRAAGEWVMVAELYRLAGALDGPTGLEVAATWLPSPTAQPGYVVVYFCDDELQWSMTAYYNAERLLGVAASVAASSPI